MQVFHFFFQKFNDEHSTICSENALQKIYDKCNKEESIGEQSLFIDLGMEAIMCKWCPSWKGSQQLKVINQHTKTSKGHQTARQKALGITPTAVKGVRDIRTYFLPNSEHNNNIN